MTRRGRLLAGSGVILLVLAGGYIQQSLQRAAQAPEPSQAPVLAQSPARVYGLVEPLGREIFIGPLQPRRVVRVAVREGDLVGAGDLLVQLDADIETQQLRLAESRVEEARRRLAITRDELRRTARLVADRAAPERDASNLQLQVKLLEQQIASARAELDLRTTALEKLSLRAPVAGKVYKLDIRVGEQLTPQDYQRIVVGPQAQQARLFVEAWWRDRVTVGRSCALHDAETGANLTRGEVIDVSPYVGARGFRSEDRLERLDTKYTQAILQLQDEATLPLGLQVVCEFQPNEPQPTNS